MGVLRDDLLYLAHVMWGTVFTGRGQGRNSDVLAVLRFFFICDAVGGWRGVWKKGDVTCVSRSNCGGLVTRLGRLRAIRHPGVSTTVTRTHSGNSLSRGTRCSTTGRTRNVLRVGVGGLGLAVTSTGVVSRSGLGASSMRVLGGMRLGGIGGNVGVICAVISRDRTGLGRKGVSIGAPVTRNLLNGGMNSVTRVGIPRNVVGLRMIGVSFWEGTNPRANLPCFVVCDCNGGVR